MDEAKTPEERLYLEQKLAPMERMAAALDATVLALTSINELKFNTGEHTSDLRFTGKSRFDLESYLQRAEKALVNPAINDDLLRNLLQSEMNDATAAMRGAEQKATELRAADAEAARIDLCAQPFTGEVFLRLSPEAAGFLSLRFRKGVPPVTSCRIFVTESETDGVYQDFAKGVDVLAEEYPRLQAEIQAPPMKDAERPWQRKNREDRIKAWRERLGSVTNGDSELCGQVPFSGPAFQRHGLHAKIVVAPPLEGRTEYYLRFPPGSPPGEKTGYVRNTMQYVPKNVFEEARISWATVTRKEGPVSVEAMEKEVEAYDSANRFPIRIRNGYTGDVQIDLLNSTIQEKASVELFFPGVEAKEFELRRHTSSSAAYLRARNSSGTLGIWKLFRNGEAVHVQVATDAEWEWADKHLRTAAPGEQSGDQ